jgi:phosphoribosylaminoimidazole-succinocarboxamide synthase
MALYADALGLPLVHAGKVRELYALDGDRLLMVATDRISAFDYVLEPLVPDKGVILNQLSLWWFDRLADLVDSHVISTEVPDVVAGRAGTVRPTRPRRRCPSTSSPPPGRSTPTLTSV